MEVNTRVNAYILAGGKSSRMGEDKGLLLLKDKIMVQYVLDELKKTFQNIFIISNNAEYQKFGVEVIPDEIKEIGAAGGIFTALKHTNSSKNFMVSCDMPFVTSNAIKFIIDNSFSSQITLPQYQGNIEPLFGVYDKSCLPEWGNQIKKGEYKLQYLVNLFSIQKLVVAEHPDFPPQIFSNINSRQDFVAALKWLE